MSTSFFFKQPKCGDVGNENRVVTWYENHVIQIGREHSLCFHSVLVFLLANMASDIHRTEA